jgi:hypothetical protein
MICARNVYVDELLDDQVKLPEVLPAKGSPGSLLQILPGVILIEL